MAEVVLRKKLHHLCSCLDPVVLSTGLYSKEIIDSRTWEEARQNIPSYDRCLKLLEILLRKVKASPTVFESFCEILEEEPVTANIAKELKDNYKQEKTSNQTTDSKKCEDEKENSICEIKNLESREKGQKRGNSPELENDGLPEKRLKVVKSWRIESDKVLLDIAKEISDKWNEVGISLDIGFKTLQSSIGSLATTVPDHRKAFLVLQEWKSRAAEKYSYQILAAALEENGLASCALKYCYFEK